MSQGVTLVASLAVLAMAGCGVNEEDRAMSGAGIGAGVGVLGGPVGMGIGAAAGAAAGAVTEPEDVNLGEPIWNDPDFPPDLKD